MTMRNIFLIALAFFISGCVTPQSVPLETAHTVEAPNKSQAEIYDKARQWFSQYFISGESVIDYEDKATGTIIGNGVATIDSSAFLQFEDKIYYNVRIDTKDGKFRALTKVIKHTTTDYKSTYTVNYVSKKQTLLAKKHIDKIVSDIESYVLDNKIGAGSDW